MKQQIRAFVNNRGYVYISNGVSCWQLHRLVALLNFGEIPDGFHVHHKDNDKLNNHPSNLEILSPKEHYQRHKGFSNRNKNWHLQPRIKGRFAKATSTPNYHVKKYEGSNP